MGVNVDSNYRFFAAIWLAMGLALATIIPRALESGTALRAIFAAVFLGGLARAVSIVATGVPDPLMLVLLAVELVVPPVLVVWHHQLTRPAPVDN